MKRERLARECGEKVTQQEPSSTRKIVRYIIYKVNDILIVVVAKSTRRPESPDAWSVSVSGGGAGGGAGGVGGGAGGGGQAHVGHVTVT